VIQPTVISAGPRRSLLLTSKAICSCGNNRNEADLSSPAHPSLLEKWKQQILLALHLPGVHVHTHADVVRLGIGGDVLDVEIRRANVGVRIASVVLPNQ